MTALSPIKKQRIMRDELTRREYQIPSAARCVRVCANTTKVGSKWTTCFYPIMFFEKKPPNDLLAGNVTCPNCNAVQPVRNDGGIPDLTLYDLPPYPDLYRSR